MAAFGLKNPLQGQQPDFRKMAPPGVLEHVGLGISNVVELKDGSVLANNGQRSRDGGRTWSEVRPLVRDVTAVALLRLRSGALALQGGERSLQGAQVGRKVWFSHDEGTNWSESVSLFPPMVSGPYLLGHEMIQLRGGRLLVSVYASFKGSHPEFDPKRVQARGLWQGRETGVETHGHVPEMYVTYVALSDDEGKTWRLASGTATGNPIALMGWFNQEGILDGNAGVTGVGEATLAETAGGKILLFARSTVNRIVASASTDGGLSWSAVVPTALANSISPPRLCRIPKTDDLLCVWNQMSREEIHRGYRRGRLSAAISKDGAASWENFKTIELSEGLRISTTLLPNIQSR